MKMVSKQCPEGFDIIGDIHGCAETLQVLLDKMGYAQCNGVYQHPTRMAIFVGDVIDRGPNIPAALELVYRMVTNNQAMIVLGNHEYNAITYCTPAPSDWKQSFLRSHSQRHYRQIASTLRQFEHQKDQWQHYIDWFKTLPLFLDLPKFRVVHACWDAQMVTYLKESCGDAGVSEQWLVESATSGTKASRAVERLTRGVSICLPSGREITSKDGYKRRYFRAKFWESLPETYGDLLFQPDPLPDDLHQRPLSNADLASLVYYSPHQKPLFVGHYWMQGEPSILQENIACVDYSAVKLGKMVAYRFDGESSLSSDKFCWVYVEPSESMVA